MEDIHALKYTDESGDTCPLRPHLRGILTALICFDTYHEESGQKIQDKDWLTITQAKFDEYQTSKEFKVFNNGIPSVNPSPAPTTASKPHDPINDFKHGIKHDVTYFEKLKDDKQWDIWQHGMAAQA